jgi:hypothetical protein
MTVQELREELETWPDYYEVSIDTSGAVATLIVENPRKRTSDGSAIIMTQGD